ncbi:hypothetical protein STSP2_00816 [Anaerohalosphaera lusitana]|uniref:Uncharacterized protein n=1 Tax=Anaerohalosphaera lusitana TaxID=1936003 RepID=A0A1U9NIU8_9BACT|nr:hypothetical protein [Anaerohalosphaera lusitana]AQT67668.1 hypothetical protein STSP2_00816 [Anaerohalosphaera lusitana]
MSSQTKPAPKQRKHPILRYSFIAVLLLVIASASGFLLLTWQSDKYEPAPPRRTERVSTFLTHDIAETWYNSVQNGKPFELIVQQKNINDVIANESQLGFKWPIELDGAQISTPAVLFEPGQVTLMAPVQIGKVPVMISILSKPRVDDEGLLTLNVESVKAGMVNITPLARKFASGMIKKQLESTDLGPEEAWLTDIADALLDNKPIEPCWPSHDDYMVRLLKTDIADQQMQLEFDPYKADSDPALAADNKKRTTPSNRS